VGGRAVTQVEHAIAVELATFMVGLITVAVSSPLPTTGHAKPTQLVANAVGRLWTAPSNREWRHIQDLATTIEQNAALWIGMQSAERYDAMLAVRNVLPALEPEPRRLLAPNIDPRRIAFLVVECARAAAPADFAEDMTDTVERTRSNVHALRTLLLRSLEHLQRVAIKEWAERNIEDQQPHRSSGSASWRAEPDPEKKGGAEEPLIFDPIADQLASAVAAELESFVGVPTADAGTDANGTQSRSTNKGLEEELKAALEVQLTAREPDTLPLTAGTEPLDRPLHEVSPSSHAEGIRPVETPAVETQKRMVVLPSESAAKPPRTSVNAGVRTLVRWMIVIAVGVTLGAAILYRDEISVVAAPVLDLLASPP